MENHPQANSVVAAICSDTEYGAPVDDVMEDYNAGRKRSRTSMNKIDEKERA